MSLIQWFPSETINPVLERDHFQLAAFAVATSLCIVNLSLNYLLFLEFPFMGCFSTDQALIMAPYRCADCLAMSSRSTPALHPTQIISEPHDCRTRALLTNLFSKSENCCQDSCISSLVTLRIIYRWVWSAALTYLCNPHSVRHDDAPRPEIYDLEYRVAVYNERDT
jgi:hypothetical protein